MTQISAFLSLNGNCREVMTFYKECFDGELFILSVEESPVAATLPAESQKSILHANLFKGNLSLLAADIIPPMELLRGNGVALFIECSSEEEIYTYFSNLSSGGQINMRLTEQFWGAIFGELTDKYGQRWSLNFAKNK